MAFIISFLWLRSINTKTLTMALIFPLAFLQRLEIVSWKFSLRPIVTPRKFYECVFSMSKLLIPLTLIIVIFYCLNYTSLLLHSTQHTCITSFPFIYCFQSCYANYRHLLLSWLHFAITSSLYNTLCNRFYNNYATNICPRKLLWFI